jgi:hypothetical protein
MDGFGTGTGGNKNTAPAFPVAGDERFLGLQHTAGVFMLGGRHTDCIAFFLFGFAFVVFCGFANSVSSSASDCRSAALSLSVMPSS